MFNPILVLLDGSLHAERERSHEEQYMRVFRGKPTLLKENVDLVVLYVHDRTGGTSCINSSVTRNYLEYGTKTMLVIQAVPLSQERPTAVEKVVEIYGRR